MPSSGERTVAVAHHPTEIQPWHQTLHPEGTTDLSQDHGHHLVAKKARARSSVIDAADVTAALVRRELVQHGARNVAFAEGRTTTRQFVGRLLRYKQGEAPNPSSRNKGKANLLARMEKQRPNTLTPLCLNGPISKGDSFQIGRSFNIKLGHFRTKCIFEFGSLMS